MEIFIISAIIGLLLATKKKRPADHDTGTGTESPATSGYFFKPAFVDTVPHNQTAYPADKWSIKNNELYYEFTYGDGTVMYRTPLMIAFNKRQIPIYPEALQRLKDLWSIDSSTLKQAAMWEFNENPDNFVESWQGDGGGMKPNLKYNHLRDLVNLVLFLRKEPRLFGTIGNMGLVYPNLVPGNPTPYCDDRGNATYIIRSYENETTGNMEEWTCNTGSKARVWPYKPVNWSKWASGAWDPNKRSGSATPWDGKGLIVPGGHTGGDPTRGAGNGAAGGSGTGSGSKVTVPGGGTVPAQTTNAAQSSGSGSPLRIGKAKRINKMFLRK